MKDQQMKVSIVDSPIKDLSHDYFGFKNRIIKNILNFLNKDITPSIIAVTGPWGSGKTSIMNLLKESEHGCQQIVFDPIIECKFEVSELLESFLLKISSFIDKKDSIKKLIELLALAAPSSVSLGLPKYGIGLEWGEIGDRLNKLIDLHSNASFSKQIEKINQRIRESEKKLLIFIDEIDRLAAEDIIKFLVFARILEIFENTRCVITFDYEQVLLKLSSHFSSNSRDDAGETVAIRYLDKFFYARYEVCSSLRENKLQQYATELLQSENIKLPSGQLSIENDQLSKNEAIEIIKLLKTPRNIKRWVIELSRINPLIKPERTQEQQMFWLTTTAIFTVEPKLLTEFSEKQKTFELASNSKLPDHIKDTFSNNLDKIPELHIRAFLDNDLEDEEKLNMIDNFFDGKNLDKILQALVNTDEEHKIIAEDIAEMISKHDQKAPKNPSFSLEYLLGLWEKSIKPQKAPYLELKLNPYYIIIMHLLNQHEPSNTCIRQISQCSLVLGEKYLRDLLGRHGIINNNGHYNLSGHKNLKEYLSEWINTEKPKFSSEINDPSSLSVISVCYRYLQWSESIGHDINSAMKTLIAEATQYFQSEKVSDTEKANFLKATSAAFNFGEDHFGNLFNRDQEILNIMKNYADTHNLKNLENYKKMFPNKD